MVLLYLFLCLSRILRAREFKTIIEIFSISNAPRITGCRSLNCKTMIWISFNSKPNIERMVTVHLSRLGKLSSSFILPLKYHHTGMHAPRQLNPFDYLRVRFAFHCTFRRSVFRFSKCDRISSAFAILFIYFLL